MAIQITMWIGHEYFFPMQPYMVNKLQKQIAKKKG